MTFSRRALLAASTGTAAAVAAGFMAQPAMAATTLTIKPLAPKAPMLIFGDSYVQGVGATDPTTGADLNTNGWAYKVGPLLNATVTVNGQRGSGYCNPALYGSGVYYDRLTKVTDIYDLIVLQGSSNDDKTTSTGAYIYDDATLRAAIEKALTYAHGKFLRAQLVMLGPCSPSGGGATRANGLLKAAAAAHAIPYIDAIVQKWFVSGDYKLFANQVNGHPNNQGHAHIRSAFYRDYQVLTGSL